MFNNKYCRIMNTIDIKKEKASLENEADLQLA